MFSGNIVLSGIGAAIYIGTMGRQIYEIRKGSEEINKYKILNGEDEELIRNLFKFFGSLDNSISCKLFIPLTIFFSLFLVFI